MTTSTSFVATSMTVLVVTTTIELVHLQPLLFPQLVADESDYLLWAKTTKVHIFTEQLSNSIAFDKDSTVSASIFAFIS